MRSCRRRPRRDAQPAEMPADAPWAERFGVHSNREPGRPLLVSAVCYLNSRWDEGWDAETLFLDQQSGTGVIVRPQPGRVALMEQDLPHRLSAPSRAAGRPRFSLVRKLALWPREGTEAWARPSVLRAEWGAPQRFGSAASAVAAQPAGDE